MNKKLSFLIGENNASCDDFSFFIGEKGHLDCSKGANMTAEIFFSKNKFQIIQRSFSPAPQ